MYFLQINFINAFEPSNFEAYLFGPNTFILCLVKKSTIPFTKGSSGPTTTRSILCSFSIISNFLKSRKSMSIFLAINRVPGVPGIHIIFLVNLDSCIFWNKACSLPPPPIKAIFI